MRTMGATLYILFICSLLLFNSDSVSCSFGNYWTRNPWFNASALAVSDAANVFSQMKALVFTEMMISVIFRYLT